MQTQKGSVIIYVLLSMAGLLTIMNLVIRYTSYSIDIAHQRVLHEQRYFASKGLLNYALTLTSKSIILNESTIDIDPWLAHYTGKIVFSVEQNMINIHAYLYFAPERFIAMQHIIPKKFPSS